MSAEILVFTCFNCGNDATACPQCVNTIRIDPETQMPPDVAIKDGILVSITPDPEAVKRSNKTPVCDDCVARRGDTLTSRERHYREHRPERDYLD